MSEMIESKTEFKDRDALIAALKSMDLDPEVLNTAQKLNDYYMGKYGPTAEIIVRANSKSKLYKSNISDLGFKQQSDGTYSMISSDMDSDVYGKKFVAALKLSYVREGAKSTLLKKGLRFIGEQPSKDGKRVQLRFARI